MSNNMTLKFKIDKQTLTRVDPYEPVEGSLNYLYIGIQYDSTWVGLTKKLLVSYGKDTSEEVLFINDRAMVPFNVIKYPGFSVTVVGVSFDNEVVITTNPREVKILKSSDGSGSIKYVKDIQSDTLNIMNIDGHYRIEVKGEGLSGIKVDYELATGTLKLLSKKTIEGEEVWEVISTTQIPTNESIKVADYDEERNALVFTDFNDNETIIPVDDFSTKGGVSPVDKLPEVGEESLIYKLPDGSLWSWYHNEYQKEVKVIDVPGEHVQVNQYYKLKYNIDETEFLTLMNKLNSIATQRGSQPNTYGLCLVDENENYYDVDVMWDNAEQVGNGTHFEPLTERNLGLMGLVEQNIALAFSIPEMSELNHKWLDISGEGEPVIITEEQFNEHPIVVAPDYGTEQDLSENQGMVYSDFDCLFELTEEQSHIEIVTVVDEGYRRLDDENYKAVKATISEYSSSDTLEMNGVTVDYDEENKEIIIDDETSYTDNDGIHLVDGGKSTEGEWYIKPIQYVQTPTKQADKGKLMKYNGSKVVPSLSLPYITEEPSSTNTDGLIIVMIDHEPTTKYDGYLYIITEAEETPQPYEPVERE